MMIKKIEQIIDKYQLVEDGDRVVVALSGGADSCALLLSLAGLSVARRLKIIVAHFNHGLRGAESDEDEMFCKNLAQKFNLDFASGKICRPHVPQGMSPEDYFRQERYRFLNKVAAESGANKIALGHHLHDQAETVLLNILRGSGLDGLKGFLPMRENKYIRPLLDVSRKEIRNYLKTAGVECREDSSNRSSVYLRNRIRNELIPFLKEGYNPRIEQGLVRMAEIIRRDDEFINGFVSNILTSPQVQEKKNEISFSADFLKTLHTALRFRLIRALLEGLAPEGKGFSSAHVQSLVDLAIKSSSGKEISLPYGLYAQREYDHVVIKYGGREEIGDYEYPIIIPGTVDLKERHIILSTRRATMDEVDFKCLNRTYFDDNKIKGPLVIRNRRCGDWFEPLGTRGSQKIKKLFIDRKIPRRKRDRIALIADRESVIWIEDMHLSDRVKVTSETRNVLILEIRPLSRGLERGEENI